MANKKESVGKKKLDNNLLSIDLGYSGVKYYYKYQDKEYFGKVLNAVKETKKAEDGLLYENKKYLIGDSAVDFDAELSLEVDSLIKYAPLFIHYILESENIDSEGLNLVTGLSIKDFNMSNDLTKKIQSFKINNIERSFEHVLILPQGRGLAYDYFDGKEIPDIVLVFDIGYNTFDFIVLQDGKTNPDFSFANNYGINKLINNFQDRLYEEYNIERSSAELIKILRTKQLKDHGEIIDCSELIDECLNSYLAEIKNWCLKKKSSASLLARTDILLFGGGGAYYLKLASNETIKKVFGRNMLVFVDEPFEFSNARGYYKREVQK